MNSRLEDEYFSIARNDLRKKISGLLTQTITSQIWKKNFMDSLSKHPNLSLGMLDYAIYHCDACNTSRKSTVSASASNGPYNSIGFEPETEGDSDSDSEPEKDKSVFVLGRFCAERARLFHEFTHWEHSLFRSLEAEVRNHSGFDIKDGDAVMEKLVEKKVIEHEFQNLKRMIKRAQNLDGGRQALPIDYD